MHKFRKNPRRTSAEGKLIRFANRIQIEKRKIWDQKFRFISKQDNFKCLFFYSFSWWSFLYERSFIEFDFIKNCWTRINATICVWCLFTGKITSEAPTDLHKTLSRIFQFTITQFTSCLFRILIMLLKNMFDSVTTQLRLAPKCFRLNSKVYFSSKRIQCWRNLLLLLDFLLQQVYMVFSQVNLSIAGNIREKIAKVLSEILNWLRWISEVRSSQCNCNLIASQSDNWNDVGEKLLKLYRKMSHSLVFMSTDATFIIKTFIMELFSFNIEDEILSDENLRFPYLISPENFASYFTALSNDYYGTA